MGIDPEDFAKLDCKVARDEQKIIYTSSHVRGLAYLYKKWPEIKKRVPGATLDVYYGRETYDAVHRGNPERMQWMDGMIQQAKDLDGVTDHGKVGQDKIAEEMSKSAIWAYPCPWPEIYCITAIKAQASGAIPVATDYAALNETIQFGYKHHLGNDLNEFPDKDLDEWVDKLCFYLENPDEQEKIRDEMRLWGRSKSWQKVAQDWSSEFER